MILFGKMTRLAWGFVMTAFRVLVLATAATSGVLLAPAVASAHAMHAKVTVADEVKVEVYFDEEMPGDFGDHQRR